MGPTRRIAYFSEAMAAFCLISEAALGQIQKYAEPPALLSGKSSN